MYVNLQYCTRRRPPHATEMQRPGSQLQRLDENMGVRKAGLEPPPTPTPALLPCLLTRLLAPLCPILCPGCCSLAGLPIQPLALPPPLVLPLCPPFWPRFCPHPFCTTPPSNPPPGLPYQICSPAMPYPASRVCCAALTILMRRSDAYIGSVSIIGPYSLPFDNKCCKPYYSYIWEAKTHCRGHERGRSEAPQTDQRHT